MQKGRTPTTKTSPKAQRKAPSPSPEDDPQLFTYRPLGWLNTDFKQKFGTPRQGSLAKSSRARVVLAPEWRGRGVFAGLEGFSHVWLLTHLHLSVSKRQRGKVHPPRLKGAKVGVLASRSPHRPNNIGLTLAKIVGCEKDHLELAEIDIVDGTPILDVKPYLAQADRPDEYKNGWIDQLKPTLRTVSFLPQALTQLESLKSADEQQRLRQLILEMLTQDPRPPAYWGRKEAQFAIWVSGLNVFFDFRDEQFTITRIEAALNP